MKRVMIAAALAVALIAIGVASAAVLTGCAPSGQATGATNSQKKDPNKGKAGFTIRLGDDFSVGKNFIDDMGLSVALVVDVSGSMSDRPKAGGQPKYVQASESLARVLTFLCDLSLKRPDVPINVVIYRFSEEVEPVVAMTRVSETLRTAIPKVTDPELFEPQGGTAIGLAMERACASLAQSGTIMNSMIVITDGENTEDPNPEDVLLGMASNKNDKCTVDQPVYTDSQLVSFIGFDVSESIFGPLSRSGARIISAKDGAEVTACLTKILDADITRLEAK